VFRGVEIIHYGGQIRFAGPVPCVSCCVLSRLVAAWWSITLPCARRLLHFVPEQAI
jgi:hypothetical protein